MVSQPLQGCGMSARHRGCNQHKCVTWTARLLTAGRMPWSLVRSERDLASFTLSVSLDNKGSVQCMLPRR